MDSPKGDYTRRKGQVFPTSKKVKTLKMDSPKGDYTRRKGQVFSTSQKSKSWFWIPRRETTPDDILAKVLVFQELRKKWGLEKRLWAMQHVFLRRISMRVLLA